MYRLFVDCLHTTYDNKPITAIPVTRTWRHGRHRGHSLLLNQAYRTARFDECYSNWILLIEYYHWILFNQPGTLTCQSKLHILQFVGGAIYWIESKRFFSLGNHQSSRIIHSRSYRPMEAFVLLLSPLFTSTNKLLFLYKHPYHNL